MIFLMMAIKAGFDVHHAEMMKEMLSTREAD